MSKKNTLLFGASLLTAFGAIAADYAVSDAPAPVASQDESFNPCAAALPPAPGQRSYDDLASQYSGAAADAPAPEPAAPPAGGNPCSAGAF
ncbi:hypothetical protein DKP76_05140 [Falsochrobactrum shanghaiense]|uniref:Porin n=1 Tax=Falsochrobactrum shanghaiense TaxID=2201899 RepID=A0A316JAH4_9HYPH|nr:hypothetical protein [Falsochrobactrum shanghaiense]PWL18484.1 hypothetical protein DKP76_05140 [Falsochrobactrum shanghaiense]